MAVGEQPHQIEVGPAGPRRCLHGLLRPGPPTVLGRHHQGPEANRNTLPGIEEMHGEQWPVLFAGQALDLPGVTTVGGGQDRPPVANGPTLPGIDERHTVESRGQGHRACLTEAFPLIVGKQHHAMVADGNHALLRPCGPQQGGLRGIARLDGRHGLQWRGLEREQRQHCGEQSPNE
ncbi:hypothetical protein D9M68_785480 [compost metagenome]